MLFLINCLFDVKELHDELSRRLELKAQLAKEKGKFLAVIKEIESKLPDDKSLAATRKASSLADKIHKMHVKVDEIVTKQEKINLRTNPLGLDRDYNEYFYFKWDSKRIYCKRSTPTDGNISSEVGH